MSEKIKLVVMLHAAYLAGILYTLIIQEPRLFITPSVIMALLTWRIIAKKSDGAIK